MPRRQWTFTGPADAEADHVVHQVITAGIRETPRGPRLGIAYAGHVPLAGFVHDVTRKGSPFSVRTTRLGLN